jgi:lipopolysaccharide transport system ATP-binding protein
MSSDVSIRAAGLAKAYRVYPTPMDRLRQAAMPRLRRLAAPLLRALGRPLEAPPYFSEHWALRSLSFEVFRGETVGVIGRNGSGKSTLLQLICGTLTPSQGEVQVNGRVAALLELGSGFNPEYTGRENIFLNASVLGLSRAETEARLADILAFADIGEAVDQPTKTYSSGMAMRLAFAVIAHVDADVLIIDEALAVGDAYFQQKCLRWLRAFQKNGTVLFCSHDTGAVISFCTRAIWLDGGRVRMMGTAKEVSEGYTTFTRELTSGIAPTSPGAVEAPAAAATGSTAAPVADPSAAGEAPAPASPAPEAGVGIGSLPQSLCVSTLEPPDGGFGVQEAKVVATRFSRADGGELGLLAGGELVKVEIEVASAVALVQPLIGFFVKDRLGQPLFGDNTYATYLGREPKVEAGTTIRAEFRFRLPLMRSGDYSITAAIADGTLLEHVVQHWIHDALIFKVNAPLSNGVLIGIPMERISLAAESAGR